jgi:hypothetical protein
VGVGVKGGVFRFGSLSSGSEARRLDNIAEGRRLSYSAQMSEDDIYVEVSEALLSTFATEGQFTGLAVDLLVEVGSFVAIAASATDSSRVWTREQATAGGNVVRLFKLIHAVLDQTCQRRGEIVMIMARLCFETVVNIRYLAKHLSADLVRSYINYSLRYERRLNDLVTSNIVGRGGVVLPIEDRMLKSIARTCAAAGIKLEEIDTRAQRDWGGKNTFDKATDLGLDEIYFVVFGGGNHSVHGNWPELYGNHLEWDGEDSFTAQTEWQTPRPQVLFLVALLATEAVDDFLNLLNASGAEREPWAELVDLRQRIALAISAHEAYLQTKTWPEI